MAQESQLHGSGGLGLGAAALARREQQHGSAALAREQQHGPGAAACPGSSPGLAPVGPSCCCCCCCGAKLLLLLLRFQAVAASEAEVLLMPSREPCAVIVRYPVPGTGTGYQIRALIQYGCRVKYENGST